MVSLPLLVEVVPAITNEVGPRIKEEKNDVDREVDHLLGYLQQLNSSVISMSLVKM